MTLHLALRPPDSRAEGSTAPRQQQQRRVLSVRRTVRLDGSTQCHVLQGAAAMASAGGGSSAGDVSTAATTAAAAGGSRWEAVSQAQLQERLRPLGLGAPGAAERAVVAQSRHAVGCRDPLALVTQLGAMLGEQGLVVCLWSDWQRMWLASWPAN